MLIGSVDVKETTKLIAKIKRHEKEQRKQNSDESNSTPSGVVTEIAAKMNLVPERDMPSTSAESSQKAHCSQNTTKLPTLAKICDRYGLSDRSAAAVASAVLQDLGIITEDRTEQIIDKNKPAVNEDPPVVEEHIPEVNENPPVMTENSPVLLSSEQVRPFPKAGPRQNTRKGRKKDKRPS